MPGLTSQQIARIVYRYIGVEGGYLGDFSYATHAQFYPLYCDLDIDPYQFEGTTRERFMAILESLPPHDQRKVVAGVVERFPVSSGGPDSRTEELRDQLLQMASTLDGVATPDRIGVDRASVTRAISDAEVLIRSNGATSGVDRVHTALHGYLISACESANIDYPAEPTMTKLLKLLRSEHPQLSDLGPRATDIERVLNSFGSVLDALNPLRNRASVAHPNELLLEEAEARLVLNGAMTILGYVELKLNPPSSATTQSQGSLPLESDEEPF